MYNHDRLWLPLPVPPSPLSPKKTSNSLNWVDDVLLNAFKDGVLDRNENLKLVSTLVDCSVEYIQDFVKTNRQCLAA